MTASSSITTTSITATSLGSSCSNISRSSSSSSTILLLLLLLPLLLAKFYVLESLKYIRLDSERVTRVNSSVPFACQVLEELS